MTEATNTNSAAKTKAKREPLLRVAKRNNIKSWQAACIRVGGVLVALIINAIFILATTGVDPITAYATMFRGAFGNSIYIWSTINSTVKLLCIAVALAPAFKMRFWNIGAEGQVLIGALMTAIVMVNFADLPAYLLFPLMFLSAAVGGAVWAVIPAIFKAKWGTNETLFTLMMNYVAIQLVSFFYNLWKGSSSSLGQLNKIGHEGWFPAIMGQRTFINVIIVVILTVVMYFYLSKTKQGYEISVVGESQNTARYAGINVKAVLIRTMAISGLVCGVCGCMTVAGQSQTISTNIASGYGFTAIIVAWLSKFNTFYMAGISLFIVALEKGTALISNRFSSFSASACDVVVGIMLFCVIGCEFFINYRVLLRGKEAVK